MGATQSTTSKKPKTGQFGHIYVHTDKKEYFMNETVTGQIHLNIYKDFPGNTLYLRLYGKEIARIVVKVNTNSNSDSNNDHYDDVLRSSKNIVMDKVATFHTFDQQLEKGQYTIAFSFLLPPRLPCYNFYQEGPKYLGSIAYYIEAFVPARVHKDVKLRSKQIVFLKETPRDYAIPPNGIIKEVKTNLTEYMCCSRGSSILKVKFDKNCYKFGETAQATIQLRNTMSQFDMNNITFSFLQYSCFSTR